MVEVWVPERWRRPCGYSVASGDRDARPHLSFFEGLHPDTPARSDLSRSDWSHQTSSLDELLLASSAKNNGTVAMLRLRRDPRLRFPDVCLGCLCMAIRLGPVVGPRRGRIVTQWSRKNLGNSNARRVSRGYLQPTQLSLGATRLASSLFPFSTAAGLKKSVIACPIS
jgi:hypothetical protein